MSDKNLKRYIADLDHALANAEHWMSECENLEAQLAEAQKDTERLEWLTKGISEEWNPETREYFKHIPIPYIPCMIGERSRQAIDTAMKEGE